MATRQDIHSPKNFSPNQYVFVGAFDSAAGYPPDSPAAQDRLRLTSALAFNGFNGGNWETKGKCDHCGATIRYVCVFRHDNGEYIATGETCAEEAFGHHDRLSYDVARLKKAAAAERERKERERQVAIFFEEHKDLDGFLTTGNQHNIIADIASKLHRWGSLSEAQINLVYKIKNEQTERAAQKAAQQTEVKIPAPEGRIDFAGTVVAIKEQWSDYVGGYIDKLVIKVPAGYTVWVSRLSKLSVNVGDWVAMTATLKRSNRDESFAFGSRPSKATVMRKEEASSLD